MSKSLQTSKLPTVTEVRTILGLRFIYNIAYVIFRFVHSRGRSNVFGDARFWFLPKPNQILQFTQILPKYFTQISLK